MKYRIVTNGSDYRIQYKFLWFWVFLKTTLPDKSVVPKLFKLKGCAKDHIDMLQKPAATWTEVL